MFIKGLIPPLLNANAAFIAAAACGFMRPELSGVRNAGEDLDGPDEANILSIGVGTKFAQLFSSFRLRSNSWTGPADGGGSNPPLERGGIGRRALGGALGSC